jgi:putative tryptophan/tyrosine transport system substrate-binding protein
VNLFLPCLRSLRRFLWCLVPVCAALTVGHATAAGFTVLLADDSAPHAEFARQMRAVVDDAPVTIAVGMAAARAAIARPGAEPLLLAMLSQLDYERLRTDPHLLRTDRRVGVLLRDPAMADQLALIDAVLPLKKRRLGVVATFDSGPLVHDLERAAVGWDLTVQYAPGPTALAAALRTVVARSDALMVLPDRIGDSQAATLSVLLAGAGATLPVFGASDGLVRSGGLAAAVSTPTQLAAQARVIVHKLQRGAGGVVLVEAATPATVRVNATVARRLGMRLPDERELTERVTAPR